MDVPQTDTVALVGSTWRFLKPIRPGSTVHSVWRLGRKREVTNPRWGLVVWQVNLIDHASERVLEGEISVLVNRRDAPPALAPGRRRRRGRAPVTSAAPTAEANLPEPAPADTPSQAQRRRRPRAAPAVSTPAPEVSAAPPPATVAPEAASPAAPVVSPSRRRRRRRGGSGQGTGSNSQGNANGASPVEAVSGAERAGPDRSEPGPVSPPATQTNLEIVRPKLAPAFERAPEPPRPTTWAAPMNAEPKADTRTERAQDASALGRVFGRLRRPRPKPAAPSPGDTRSPSE